MKYKRLRGVKDVTGDEGMLWENMIKTVTAVIKSRGYRLIITPVIEETALFVRGIGEASDIVLKEMYDFKDKKGRNIVLRPEGTASVVRAYIENSLPEKSDLYYIGPMFRYERPQTGRYREFFQAGVESFGDGSPYKDAEIIIMGNAIIKKLGISARLVINNLGGAEEYAEKLKTFLEGAREALCDDCLKKLERAPLRVLDCKKTETCGKAVKDAPKITEYLNGQNLKNYSKIKQLLKDAGVDFREDPKMVRGLDYYTGTVFEFITDKLGPQQNTILAGGRYDNLVKELGGKQAPATGFALGFERISEVIKAEKSYAAGIYETDVFVVTQEGLADKGFLTLEKLRADGVSAGMSFEVKSFKAQMREAASKGACFAVIIGESEARKGSASVKNMKDGVQVEVEFENLSDFIKGRQ
ncbi:MAG TPA: histidine--tRNA ligase [Firmicutes bacterium]|nr:histidine--tRNA ligase [Bacillota bacterium]